MQENLNSLKVSKKIHNSLSNDYKSKSKFNLKKNIIIQNIFVR